MLAARITPSQGKALRFIEKYLADNAGVSPSCKEIAAGIGIASKGRVSDLLCALEVAGCIRRLRGHNRSIEVLQPPLPPGQLPSKWRPIPVYDADSHRIREYIR